MNETQEDILEIEAFPEPGNTYTVDVQGSKNCALPIIMYTFLHDGSKPITLKNVPNIVDVQNSLALLKAMGGTFDFNTNTSTLIVTQGIQTSDIPHEILVRTHISVLMMSIMLVKYKEVRFPKVVGGCKLGERKHDFHLEAFKGMGCTVTEKDDYHLIEHTHTPESVVFEFPKTTTSGTENALFFAAHSTKKAILKRGHLRPEILELIVFMNRLGSNISIENDDIIIHGNTTLQVPEGFTFTIIDDMEEALSYVTLGLATDSHYDIMFNNPYYYREMELLSVLGKGSFVRDYRVLHQHPFNEHNKSKEIDITTKPYPLVGSDSQPILAATLLKTTDAYSITETRFRDRFAYTTYMDKFNIPYTLEDQTLRVTSRTQTHNDDSNVYDLEAYDLRSGINAVLTATMLKKKVRIHNAHIILRGYTDFYTNLKKLGFTIRLS